MIDLERHHRGVVHTFSAGPLQSIEKAMQQKAEVEERKAGPPPGLR